MKRFMTKLHNLKTWHKVSGIHKILSDSSEKLFYNYNCKYISKPTSTIMHPWGLSIGSPTLLARAV